MNELATLKLYRKDEVMVTCQLTTIHYESELITGSSRFAIA